jgi:SAM-dependent methyltransferase
LRPKTTTFVEKHPEASVGMRKPDVADAGPSLCPTAARTMSSPRPSWSTCPTPLRTLNEWRRLLKPGGILFVMLPHSDRTFDRHREKTTLEHHIRDFGLLGDEPNHSHDEEAAQAGPGWKTFRPLKLPIARPSGRACGFDHRIAHGAMHYYVWTQDEIVRLLQHLGLKIVAAVDEVTEPTRQLHRGRAEG